MTLPTGYRLFSYGELIADRPRMQAYHAALQRCVTPGCVVVDIGAGTGIFAQLACQLGAARVHAIEPHSAIEVARKTSVANGLSEKITFHRTLSTSVRLPERADVIVSDLRSILPLFERHIPTIVDARQRLLAPGGVLIGRRDVVWAAPYEDAEVYRGYEDPWRCNEFGLDLSKGRERVVNTWRKVNAKPEGLLADPRKWAELDYRSIEKTDVAGELSWTAGRVGTVHGVVVWFDAELCSDVGFSNAPGQPELVYGQAFFPLQHGLALEEGDRVHLRLAARWVGGDYVWHWDTRVTGPGEAGPEKASFHQSTYDAAPIPLDRLAAREAGFVPARTTNAEIDQTILSLVDGQHSLGEIAASLQARFPNRFPREPEALTRVADVVARYREGT